MTIGNYQGWYKFARKKVELYQQHPEIISYKPTTYIISLHSLIEACSQLNKFGEVKQNLDLILKESEALTAKGNKFFLLLIHHQLLHYYYKTGDFEKGIKVLGNIQKEMYKYESKIDVAQRTILYFDIAIIYFGAGRWRECISWLNKIKDGEHLLVRPDIDNMFRIFYLIAQYENKNYNLLPYLIRSTHRHFSLNNRLFKFEDIVFNFLGKDIFKAKSKKELMELFKGLKNKFIQLQKDSYEKKPFEDFDYISWLESKIENKSFSEIIQGKIKQG
jgi:hypothetical protein